MTLKRNVIANYISQAYTTALGILMVPVYLRYLGAETYGLVGFFAMMSGWLQLLEMGMGPMLGRETASYRGGGCTEAYISQLARALVGIFLFTALLVGALVWGTSEWISVHWLQAQTLSLDALTQCISIMGAVFATRWLSGLYRNIVSGWEQMVWLGYFSVVTATVRYAGVIGIFLYINRDPVTFFLYQWSVAGLELLVLWMKAGFLLPAGVRRWPSLAIEPLKRVWKFSGALAFCSIVWVFITQTDKLILSKTLNLTDYGYFTLASVVAGSGTLFAGPIIAAVQPRLVFLASQQRRIELEALYRRTTQVVSVVVWPVAATLAFFAEPVLQVWTSNFKASQYAAPVLQWYVLGNAFLAIAAFQYYLQFAYGELRLHVIGNAFFVLMLVPGIIWASIYYGAIGAARMWFVENLIFMLLWTWIVHLRYAPGLHWKWISRDVLPIAVISLLSSWQLQQWITLPAGRWQIGTYLLILGLITLGLAAVASSELRVKFINNLYATFSRA